MEYMMLEWLVVGFHGTPMTHVVVGLVHHLRLIPDFSSTMVLKTQGLQKSFVFNISKNLLF
jgi:hypothetical protein